MTFRTPSDRQGVSVRIWWAIGHESSNESGSDSGSDDQYTSNYSHISTPITMSFRRRQLGACFVLINFRFDIEFAFRHIAKHVTALLWIIIFILYLINLIINQSYLTLHATHYRSGSCGAFHPRTPARVLGPRSASTPESRRYTRHSLWRSVCLALPSVHPHLTLHEFTI